MKSNLNTDHPSLGGFAMDRRHRILNIIEGLKRVLQYTEEGTFQSDAWGKSDVVALTGSWSTSKRYWSLVRNAPMDDWVGLVASKYSTTSAKSLKATKKLGPIAEQAALEFIKNKRFYAIADVYACALAAALKGNEDLPSCKWFERHFKRGLGMGQ